MKVGDKVFIEVEVKQVNELGGTFRGILDNKTSYCFDIPQAITQLPIQEGRWMMVGSCFGSKMHRAFVIGKVEELFVTFDSCNGFARWKYAKEIPFKRKLTMQEIANAFDLDVDNIEIV